MNAQASCALPSRLSWISDPVNGSQHNTHFLSESGILLTLDHGNWVGNKGYIGNDMITPIKKLLHRELLDWENELNTQINKIRWVTEQAIAGFEVASSRDQPSLFPSASPGIRGMSR